MPGFPIGKNGSVSKVAYDSKHRKFSFLSFLIRRSTMRQIHFRIILSYLCDSFSKIFASFILMLPYFPVPNSLQSHNAFNFS